MVYFLFSLFFSFAFASQNDPQVLKNSDEIVILKISPKDQPLILLCQQYPIELNFMDEKGRLTSIVDIMFERELEPVIGMIQRFEEPNSIILTSALSHKTYQSLKKSGDHLSDVMRITRENKDSFVVKVDLKECSAQESRVKKINLELQPMKKEPDFVNFVEVFFNINQNPVINQAKHDITENPKVVEKEIQIVEKIVEKVVVKVEEKIVVKFEEKEDLSVSRAKLKMQDDIDLLKIISEEKMVASDFVIEPGDHNSILAIIGDKTKNVLLRESMHLAQANTELSDEDINNTDKEIEQDPVVIEEPIVAQPEIRQIKTRLRKKSKPLLPVIKDEIIDSPSPVVVEESIVNEELLSSQEEKQLEVNNLDKTEVNLNEPIERVTVVVRTSPELTEEEKNRILEEEAAEREKRNQERIKSILSKIKNKVETTNQ